ncbi:hypothetical protein QU593_10095 [Rossellomorea marisflavi]|uniref:NUMOD4 domain-containing protein n=1 Tax=Rossellomorea marisflavi TaxID=189381 RepID=UPI0025B10209|nr:NUMOD4 domain-containing protein [Rossellomorea marisflavi]WJV20755.1 hypothetical protein QU593_10095 [Rossellomorea marisflavi]
MNELRRIIPGYNGLYEMTESGRIFSLKRHQFLSREGNEYGFHTVKLYGNDKATNHNVYRLWKEIFSGDIESSSFKGAKLKRDQVKRN